MFRMLHFLVMYHTNYFRVIELCILFLAVPILLIYTEDIFPLIPTIILITLGVVGMLRLQGWQYRELFILGPRKAWIAMIALFLFFAIVWISVVLVWFPESFLEFPRSAPQIWIFVMFLYPLLSAFPQEILYRTYFFHRYEGLFSGNKWALIIVPGFLFMWGHLLFMNPIALGATLLGGLVIGWRYYHTRSVLLASVEHALYGNLFFTIGLGQFIYSGAV